MLLVIRIGCQAGGGAAEIPMTEDPSLRPYYLEVVTPEVDSTCDSLASTHGVVFSDPVAALGGARTATTAGGGRIGVRAPMHAAENSVVRPYMLVSDLEAAVANAVAAGAEVAVPQMPIEGEGTIAIYILGGIEHGLWQL